MNTAIIVAAGSGTRFGGGTPKQFVLLKDKPIIEYSLERFSDCEVIDEIVLVVEDSRVDHCAEFSSAYPKINAIVAGGKTRAQSVRNGLRKAETAEIVAVHDGARPLVSVGDIEKCVLAAKEFGAACLAVPVSDTIKRVEAGFVIETVDRDSLMRAVTPQCFERELLLRAIVENTDWTTATDESSIVERLPHSVKIVRGEETNIKITTPNDLRFAESVLEAE
ncbi:MAG: 2-C-methyl-D-erythritol 4-phosphate cytidylyltransferase [Pyrinomonadaceae bacterium]